MDTTPDVKRMTGTLGAEVIGFDLSLDLDDESVDWIEEQFVEHKVLFFRDQDLSSEQHVAFSARFGPVLDVHPWSPSKRGYRKVMEIRGAAAGFHSDETWRDETPLGSVLYGRVVPEFGGDTVFVDMERVYDELPEDVKQQIDGLDAVHDHLAHRQRHKARGASEEQIEAWKQQYPEVVHPIVRTHPVSGRKSVFVNGGFTSRIVGMEHSDSQDLLSWLYRRVDQPKYQCRFKWEDGSIAFWDNRSVQHAGVPDYGDQTRVMERCTIAGDKPV